MSELIKAPTSFPFEVVKKRAKAQTTRGQCYSQSSSIPLPIKIIQQETAVLHIKAVI